MEFYQKETKTENRTGEDHRPQQVRRNAAKNGIQEGNHLQKDPRYGSERT